MWVFVITEEFFRFEITSLHQRERERKRESKKLKKQERNQENNN